MCLYSVTLHAQRQLRLNEAISVEFKINGTVVFENFHFWSCDKYPEINNLWRMGLSTYSFWLLTILDGMSIEELK